MTRGLVAVDPEAIAQAIKDALASRQEVMAAYLFGSFATGHAHELSDVDVAVLFPDEDVQAIAERRLQLAIQVCMDVASYLVGQLALKAPDEPANLFTVLARAGIIDQHLGQRMAVMVRFRNILVHGYLEINDHMVYQHLTEELDDFVQFGQDIVEKFLPGHPGG